MRKLKYYSQEIAEHLFVPNNHFRKKLHTIFAEFSSDQFQSAISRANYYFKRKTTFELSQDAQKLSDLSCFDKSAYYYDLRSVVRYFPEKFSFHCWLRDVISVPSDPCFVKCRPIDAAHDNRAILKLNQIRHFREIKDTIPFGQKVSKLVWRGSVFQRSWRAEFVKKLIRNPLCDVGANIGTGGMLSNEFERDFMPIREQLKYKFIFSIEGADVATNLKWIAQSNSLCFMKKPKHESWFMEAKLIPGVHYVEVDAELNDLSEKIDYYKSNSEEALEIIRNMKLYHQQFQDRSQELLVSLLVAAKYFCLSGQFAFPEPGVQECFFN